jgi:hypothetical protein
MRPHGSSARSEDYPGTRSLGASDRISAAPAHGDGELGEIALSAGSVVAMPFY